MGSPETFESRVDKTGLPGDLVCRCSEKFSNRFTQVSQF